MSHDFLIGSKSGLTHASELGGADKHPVLPMGGPPSAVWTGLD